MALELVAGTAVCSLRSWLVDENVILYETTFFKYHVLNTAFSIP